MYMYRYVCIYTYIYVCIYMYAHIWIYVQICVFSSFIFTYLCIFIYWQYVDLDAASGASSSVYDIDYRAPQYWVPQLITHVLCHDSSIVPWLMQCAMTHDACIVPWLNSLCHDSFIDDGPQQYEASLFIAEWCIHLGMTHSLCHDVNVPWLIHCAMKSLYPDVIHCAMAYSLRQRHDAASVSRAMCAAHESAVHCSVLQRVATCFSVVQWAAGVCAALLYCADTLLLCYESFNRASAMPHLNAIHTCHPHSQHVSCAA